ncbi:MAG: ATP-binding cassette domain-containing protein [Acidovorax sp.]|nr:ATP-binding cassette domain-containing protein [Acidovorax sp.]
MTTPTPPALHLRGLHHAYGPTPVLDGIDLHLPAGRTVALVGPSGCGKTTLLHLCAGLLAHQQGHIDNGFRQSAVMFQQPRLLPWMTTLDNIALGLKAQGLPRAGRHQRAAAAALALGLAPPALAQFPAELSGGMQSRAALARALVLAPDLLLMDEPFGALDVGLRSQLHHLLLARQAAEGMAVLLITHDLMEAVRLADTVLVMAAAPGRIVAQYAPPGPALARGDALVYRCTAELLQHPQVRAVFGLPEGGSAPPQSAPDLGRWQPMAQAAPTEKAESCG